MNQQTNINNADHTVGRLARGWQSSKVAARGPELKMVLDSVALEPHSIQEQQLLQLVTGPGHNPTHGWLYRCSAVTPHPTPLHPLPPTLSPSGAGHAGTLLLQTRAVGVDWAGGHVDGGSISADGVGGTGQVHCSTGNGGRRVQTTCNMPSAWLCHARLDKPLINQAAVADFARSRLTAYWSSSQLLARAKKLTGSIQKHAPAAGLLDGGF